MRIARITTSNGPRLAEFDPEHGWHVLDGTIGAPLARSGETVSSEAQLLAPCEPKVVIGMAHNSLPEGRDLPTQAFLKSARTVVGPDEPILLDPRIGETQVETELAIVIGQTSRHLTQENALEAVFGYTIGNDVTSFEQISADELLTQAKQGDGYTPLGPWIETDLMNFDDLGMRVFVDDILVAEGSTSALANLVRDQLVYVTRYLTLGPGDVVLGGCPGTFASVTAGQHVRLEIDGLGALENSVRSLGSPTAPSSITGADAPKEGSHATHL